MIPKTVKTMTILLQYNFIAIKLIYAIPALINAKTLIKNGLK